MISNDLVKKNISLEMRSYSMKTNESLLAERNKHIPQGPFNTHPIFAEKAKGAIITDVEGKGVYRLCRRHRRRQCRPLRRRGPQGHRGPDPEVYPYLLSRRHVRALCGAGKETQSRSPRAPFPKRRCLPIAGPRPWKTGSRSAAMRRGGLPSSPSRTPSTAGRFWP